MSLTRNRTQTGGEPSNQRMMRLQTIPSNLRRAMCIVLPAFLFLALVPHPVIAHGPCGAVGSSCLEPNEGPPGTEVTTGDFEGIFAVWNPRPNILALGVPGSSKECDINCAKAKSIYHFDQPMVVVAEADDRSQLQFGVPDVPPGKYIVVMYDGSEGGRHYTWNTFKVTGVAPADGEDRPTAEPTRSTTAWLFAGGMLVAGLVAGWGLGRRRSTRLN
jgi:hypothetical protein